MYEHATGACDRAPLVVVGDALLDRDLTGAAGRLAPDCPVPVVEDCEERIRPGGAALAALLAAREGRHVTLVTALGGDRASRTLRALLDARVTLVPLELDGELPVKTRVFAQSHQLARVDQGAGRIRAAVPDAARAALESARAVLVADYGRGCADVLRAVLAGVARRTPLVWDPHPRGGPPVPGTRLATPTAAEAGASAGADAGAGASDGTGGTSGTGGTGGVDGTDSGGGADRRDPHGLRLRATAHNARSLAGTWGVASVAVTLGSRGALLTQSGSPLLVPAPERHERDACGAGDSFAAAAAGLLADGALPEEAVRGAVRAATAYVAQGGAVALARPASDIAVEASDAVDANSTGDREDTGGISPYPQNPGQPRAASTPLRSPTVAEPAPGTAIDPAPGTANDTAPDAAARVISATRADGGTIVATGGCFDVLHAGHIGLLQTARGTGDCLVVCVNSDASVQRRKGRGRPVNPLRDRVRVLRALEGVDAVAVFDEDTPERLLAQLRPDIWVKGGDYALSELPEAALLEEWGGQAVLLPYLDGRSTSSIAARTTRTRGGP